MFVASEKGIALMKSRPQRKHRSDESQYRLPSFVSRLLRFLLRRPWWIAHNPSVGTVEQGSWTRSLTALPPDIVDSLLERLPLPDYIRFGAVAKPCRDVLADHRLRWAPSPPRFMSQPWLLFHRREKTRPIPCFSPFEQRSYRIGASGGVYCLSSSHGWLLYKISFHQVSFRHLISGAVIPLPKLDNEFDFQIAGVSSPPTELTAPCLILIVARRFLYLHRIGDPGWAKIPYQLQRGFGSTISRVIWFGGRFYASTYDRGLLVVDPSLPSLQLLEISSAALPQFVPTDAGERFLVESAGELLMPVFLRCGCPKFFCKKIVGWKVFRVDLSAMEWIEVEDLGDRVLFLSRCMSVSLPASQLGCGRGNLIYRASGRSMPENRLYDEDGRETRRPAPFAPWVVFDLLGKSRTDGALPEDMKKEWGRYCWNFDAGDDLAWIIPTLV